MNTANTKILIIEDDQFLNKVYKSKLEKEGYEIISLTDSDTSVETAEAEQPACILLDLILPTLSGFEVLVNLKKNPKTKDIPVLILSNLGQQTDIQRGLEEGAAAYFVKADISPDEVIQNIKIHIA